MSTGTSGNKAVVVDKKELKRLINEKKGFGARNEKKIESRFAKYPFRCTTVTHIYERCWFS